MRTETFRPVPYSATCDVCAEGEVPCLMDPVTEAYICDVCVKADERARDAAAVALRVAWSAPGPNWRPLADAAIDAYLAYEDLP